VTSWTTPYKDSWRILPYGIAVAGTAFTASGIGMVATRSQNVGAVLIVVPPLGMWLTFVWRLARTGLVISDTGVRVRWVHRTRTFTWNRVRRFHTARDILAPGRLWIELTDGIQVRTPVQRVRNMVLGSALSDGGTWLTPGRYEALLQTLDNRLALERPTQAGSTRAVGPAVKKHNMHSKVSRTTAPVAGTSPPTLRPAIPPNDSLP
jgi:hypothetical protein